MKKLKNIIIAITLSLSILNPVVVLAQTTSTAINVAEYTGVQGSITQFLCTPSEGKADGKDIERCINKLYRFGIAFGGIALVFFLVYAGYLYIVGGESGKGKAKGIIQNAFIGIALLLGSYVILYFINPNLTIIKPIQPPIFTAGDFPSCEAIGFSGTCTLEDGSIAFGGDEDCAMPIAATAVKSYNNTVHNPWDTNPDTPDKHRTVRVPPNGPPGEGAVDLAVGQVAHPIYAPISGKVTVRKDKALGGTGSYVSISSNTSTGSANCDSANACANLAHIEPTVNAGDTVKAGQQIGKIFLYSGALGPHLHFELRVAGKWIVGDGKAGTWKNMQAAISQCMARKANGGSSTVAVDMSKTPAGMVEVTEASHGVKLNMKYATTDNFTGTVLYKQPKCYLTQSMADKLKKAQQAISKKGKQLEMLDCYRPRAVQDLMVAWAKGKVNWAGKQAPQPNNYLKVPYIATNGDHPLGKAVDLTFSGATMPSAFDTFSSSSHYNSSNADAKLLRETMKAAGFAEYTNEWWHFKDGGGRVAGLTASFAPADGNGVGLAPAPPSTGEILACDLALGGSKFESVVSYIIPTVFASCNANTSYNSYYTGGDQFWDYLFRQDDYPQAYGDCGSGATIARDGCGVVATSMVFSWIYYKKNGNNNLSQFAYDQLTSNSNAFRPDNLAGIFVASGFRVCGNGSKWDSPYIAILESFTHYKGEHKRYATVTVPPNKNYLNKSQAAKNEIISDTRRYVNDADGIAIALVGGNHPWNVAGHFVVVIGTRNVDGYDYFEIADPWRKSSVTLIEQDLFAQVVKAMNYFDKK